MTNTNPSPKVFISYSWTSEEHTQWVGELGERLMSDGVDVILDQWSLEDGHDVNAFMEKMVTDPSIKKVIVVCDSLYAEKADGRKGGVGTETQIISKEVYESVEQTKFIPLLRERDKAGRACLPVFLANRKYIDWSDPDKEAEAYEQLLRNILERPKRQKPALGSVPAHLFDDESVALTSVQKARRFRELVTTGKGNPLAAFDDFATEFLREFEDLRMTYSRDESETWCQRIRSNIESGSKHRDVFADVIYDGIRYLPSDQFVPHVLELLESVLTFQYRPQTIGSSFKCSEDNYKVLIYELFLYSVAAFVKAKKYAEVKQLIEHHYVAAREALDGSKRGHSFCDFNNYPNSIEEQCSQQGNSRRISVTADLIHDRANNKIVKFSDILQADVLLTLAARGRGWYPRCMVYSRDGGMLELFVRAETLPGFAPLTRILNLATPQELVSLILSEEMQRIWHSERMSMNDISYSGLNVEALKRRWVSS